MVTTYYPPYNFGGDGAFVFSLANALAARGHSVDVVHCVDAYRLRDRKEPAQATESHPGVHVHGLRSRFGALSPLATQQTGRSYFKSEALRKWLERDYDVIHYHNISLIGAGALGYGSGIKLYTPHEYWLFCPAHTLFKFNRRVCDRRQCALCTLSYARPPQWWRQSGLLESALKHVDAFLPPSRSSMELHRSAGLTGRFVHLPEFAPPELEFSGATEDGPPQPPGAVPYFLFAGRLEKLKGLHALIPFFRKQTGFRLLIAGSGTDEQALRAQAQGASNIEFLGQLPRQRLSSLYRSAIAVIVPSLCIETFSLVTVEAFQQRTPVIARNLGGPAELIGESGGGIAYETDDELQAAIAELGNNPSIRNEMGNAGYLGYRRNWTEAVHLQRYLSLIDELRQGRDR